MSKTCAVIMAGGRGSRMNASCDKPLVHLLGLPMIEHQILSLQSIQSISEIIVVCRKASKHLYKNMIGVSKVIIQDKPLGTFNAIEHTFDYVSEQKYSKLLILPGDKPFISPSDLINMINHTHNTILGYNDTSHKPVLSWQMVNGCMELVKIIEDIDVSNPNLYTTPQYHTGGVYCVGVDELILLKSDVDIHCNNSKEEYYITDIFPLLKTKTVIIPIKKSITVSNVNTPEDLKSSEETIIGNHEYIIGQKVITHRSHGRLNLMGRHIDHQGGYNNSTIIDQYVETKLEYVSLYNNLFVIESDYGRRVYDLESLYISNDWSKYVIAPLMYLNTIYKTVSHPIWMTISGNIPRGSGMSSSSALVVSSMKCYLELFNIIVSDKDLVAMCGNAEKFVGTNGGYGGYGDHAAIIFGKPNVITKMKLFPDVTIESIQYKPHGLSIYVYDSGVKAEKGDGMCNEIFNSKVRSYRKGFSWLSPQTKIYLCDLGLDDMDKIDKSDLPREVKDVMKYGYNEYNRSDVFLDKCSNLELLGELVKDSMLDEQNLYGCSCDTIDQMVKVSNNINGVLGSQICGAGMGGCLAIFAHTSDITDKSIRESFSNYALITVI